MKNLAVMVDNLGASQMAYHLIRSGNQALAEGILDDLVVFQDESVRPCLVPRFARMQSVEVWGYPGVVLATSLVGLKKLIEARGPARKLFYVWDLEWLRIRPLVHQEMLELYGAPGVDLLARSPEHARVLEDCWNRRVLGIVDDFDFQTMVEWLWPENVRKPK